MSVHIKAFTDYCCPGSAQLTGETPAWQQCLTCQERSHFGNSLTSTPFISTQWPWLWPDDLLNCWCALCDGMLLVVFPRPCEHCPKGLSTSFGVYHRFKCVNSKYIRDRFTVFIWYWRDEIASLDDTFAVLYSLVDLFQRTIFGAQKAVHFIYRPAAGRMT